VAEDHTKADVVGFVTLWGHFIAEPIDPCTPAPEADLARYVTAEALCGISPNSVR
jgi:hypothetical protein